MAQPAPVAKLTSRVELYLSAANLARRDVLSKSDPFAVLYMAVPRPVAIGQPAQMTWQEIGRTEQIRDDQSPSWTRQFLMDYAFEELQPLRIAVYDYDDSLSHDPLGVCEVPLGRVMAARGQTMSLQLTGAGAGVGSSLTVRGAEVQGSHNDELRCTIRCTGLDRKDWLGSSDPYVVINRIRPDGALQRVWTSPVIKSNLNPSWANVSLSLQVLCNGDVRMPLGVEVWDWDSDGSHDFIGAFTTHLEQLLGGSPSHTAYPLVNPKKKGKTFGSYKNSGTFTLDSAVIVRIPTLLDYIKGGLQINLIAAVDFTGSNGDPRTPSSLHYINPHAPNEYLSALTSVGTILLEYDADKRVPMYGFGGAINGQTRHCFALTFNDAAPEVVGLDGLVSAYQNSFHYVGLSGPTHFEQVIRTAHEAAQADAASGQLKYTVLLLLTDGQCNDMDQTVRAIVDASTSPLSVVIVGVGGADFAAMEVLDGDGKALSFGGRAAARDIVQFVPYRKFAAAGPLAGARLTAETLAEIPAQVVSYFMARGMPPPAPLAAHPVQLPPPAGPSVAHL